jgi:glycine/D-amino acid oxidase-like deaminating enzyme
LVDGLAKTVEDLGATLYELSPVTRILPSRPGRRPEVVTLGGRVRADVVVQATEGYTPSLGPRRTMVPLYSLMIATEPLSPAWWDHHGLRNYETFADGRHLIIYGQRTADHRLAFGGRGAPYHFGSGVDPRFDEHAGVFTALAETLRELFPDIDADITHRWGGPLAMPRDHFPRVSFDPSLGVARVGGYTGDGVTMSFVMGRLLATLLLHPDEHRDRPEIDILTRAPRRWEMEPLRFLGINAGLWLAEHTDRAERAGRDSRAGRLLERLW